MVADSLVYHPAVTHYNKFVATTVGRDKALRTIQYFSRFLAWYLVRNSSATKDTLSSAAQTASTFSLLKTNLGLVRKCMRLGKFVEHFRAAASAADARGMDPVVKFLAVGRQLGYAMYLSLDALTYLDAAGIRRSEFAKRCQVEAYRAWVMGLACSAVSGVYTLYVMRTNGLRNKDAKVGTDAEKALEGKRLIRDRQQVQLQLLSDVCDLTIPTSALGYTVLGDGVVGLAGTVSSLIGFNTQWAKTA